MPSAQNDRTVWSMSDKAGTTNSTRLPFDRAPWTIAAATTVLPKPVGAWSIGRRWPLESDSRNRSMIRT